MKKITNYILTTTTTLATMIGGCELDSQPDQLNLLRVSDLISAISEVETGGELFRDSSVGDGGYSRGRFQISLPYFIDSGIKATYQEAWSNPHIGQQVMLAYWARYSGIERRLNDAIDMETAEWLARTHNGGPRGYRKQATVKYWRKVKEVMFKK